MATTHIYLRKANDRLVSHCTCGDGHVTFPPQMDCPWCGCGWLFTCISCRKAFAFAVGVFLEEPWEQTARRDLLGRWGEEPTHEQIEGWVEAMKVLLADVAPGVEYACLDGFIIPTTEPAGRFDGWHSRHDLPYLPQVAAMTDPSVIDSVLANPEYWRSRALTDEA